MIFTLKGNVTKHIKSNIFALLCPDKYQVVSDSRNKIKVFLVAQSLLKHCSQANIPAWSESTFTMLILAGVVPRRSPLWPAEVCPACWPTAVWPQSPSSSAARSEHPANAATPSSGDQTTPAGHKHTEDHFMFIFSYLF